jgi:hypothetical protein
MSNVEYRCPTRNETGCGARAFCAPGGTKLKCPNHDVILEQTEEWHGATFEFVEDESGRSRTGRATHIRTDSRPDAFQNIKDAPKVQVRIEESPQEIMRRLRDRYQNLYHKKADKRRGEKWLREQVATKEAELEAISAARSAEMKAASDAKETA